MSYQMVVMNHSAMNEQSAKSHCSDDMEMVSAVESTDDNCCETQCSCVVGCFSLIALSQELTAKAFIIQSSKISLPFKNLKTQKITSLYRPPIIG